MNRLQHDVAEIGANEYLLTHLAFNQCRLQNEITAFQTHLLKAKFSSSV